MSKKYIISDNYTIKRMSDYDILEHTNNILKSDIMEKEFKLGATVTLDRYNHIDDVEICTVIGYGRMPISENITYKLDVNGVVISSTGVSIMESKYYIPVDDKDRHEKII